MSWLTARLCAWACKRFDLSPSRIAGHQDHADTACPGEHLQRLIAGGELLREVRARLRAEAAPR